jgi:hypothetical protein
MKKNVVDSSSFLDFGFTLFGGYLHTRSITSGSATLVLIQLFYAFTRNILVEAFAPRFPFSRASFSWGNPAVSIENNAPAKSRRCF